MIVYQVALTVVGAEWRLSMCMCVRVRSEGGEAPDYHERRPVYIYSSERHRLCRLYYKCRPIAKLVDCDTVCRRLIVAPDRAISGIQ